jgi:formylglycine-generating enzyme required for sulfatase activity
MKLMPTVTEVAHRKSTMTARISSAETNAESIKLSMEQMRLEAETIEEQRLELQARLNPLEMVLIPAGRFRMGTNTMVKGRTDETPEHSVRLKEFYIDKYEVTNIQYKEFIETTGHRSPPHWRNRTFPEARKSDHPVVNVSWDDAVAYGTWIGKRLPTEAEWERAALGSGTQEYPWKKAASTEYANYENAVGGTTSVAKYSKGQSPDGVWDMCGNVGNGSATGTTTSITAAATAPIPPSIRWAQPTATTACTGAAVFRATRSTSAAKRDRSPCRQRQTNISDSVVPWMLKPGPE